MMNGKWRKTAANERGFTFLEILFSLVIAVIILVSAIQAMLYLTATTALNKRRAQVFQDMQIVMERILNTNFSSLNSTFPNNTAVSGALVTNLLGGYKIPTESITISYPVGTTANPREILVTGSWTEQGTVRTITLRTIMRG